MLVKTAQGEVVQYCQKNGGTTPPQEFHSNPSLLYIYYEYGVS